MRQIHNATFVMAATTALGLAAPSSGQVVPCPPIDFGSDYGAPSQGFVILTDQLAEQGILFSTTDPQGVYWIGGGGYSSFTYCLHAGSLGGAGEPAGIDPIRVDFAAPAASVSIRGYDGGGDIDTMILEAYDPDDVLIDSTQITDSFYFPGHVATVTGQISYVTFRVEGALHGLFFDDLQFEMCPVICPPIDFGPDFGAPSAGFVLLTEQLFGCGVAFSTTDPEGVYWWGEASYPSSFPHCITAGSLYDGSEPAGVDPIRVDFAPPVTSASVRAYDGGGDIDTMILRAFDAGDTLVDLAQLTSAFAFPGQVGTVKGDIAYVTFEVEGTPSGLFFDDLQWVSRPCRGDTNGDGAVDETDLLNVIRLWGTDNVAADVDGSGVVDVSDLVGVIIHWGLC